MLAIPPAAAWHFAASHFAAAAPSDTVSASPTAIAAIATQKCTQKVYTPIKYELKQSNQQGYSSDYSTTSIGAARKCYE